MIVRATLIHHCTTRFCVRLCPNIYPFYPLYLPIHYNLYIFYIYLQEEAEHSEAVGPPLRHRSSNVWEVSSAPTNQRRVSDSVNQ